MSVYSYRITQYFIKCDVCGISECCPDGLAERVHTKQQAIKWARMHKVKDGRIMCDKCFKEHKKGGAE